MERMKTFRRAALSLIVVAGLGAGMTAAAQAAPPEFGKCVPAVGKTGEYKGKNCLAPAAGKGTYNWQPAPGPKPTFSGVGEKVSLETPGKVIITCAAATFEGSYTGPKTETVTATLIGCILSSSPSQQKCQTTPAKEGEIEASLEGEIGFIRGGEKPLVGLDLKPKSPSTVFATFQCGKLPETGPSGTIEGSVIAPIKPINHAAEEFKLLYQATSGKQAVEHFEGGPNDTLTVKLISGIETKTEPIALHAVVLDSNEEPTEIKAK
jgi:hypothetical protein